MNRRCGGSSLTMKGQSEDQALAEDEAAFQGQSQTLMEVPSELVPVIRQLIAKRQG